MISGEQLRQLRSLHIIVQKAFAKKLHITQQAYSKMERRKLINGERLVQIMEALGYTKEEFEKIIKNLPPPENELAISS